MTDSKEQSNSSILYRYSNYWFLAFLLIIITGLFFYFVDEIKVDNLLNIQFADSQNSIIKIIESKKILIQNTRYDFIFIVCYTLLFWLSIKVFDLTLFMNIHKKYYFLVLVPGIFDVIENFSLLMLIENTTQSPLFFNTFWFSARAKWFTIIPFVLINLIILFYYLILVINTSLKKYWKTLKKVEN